jgi:hypothetical protein
MQSENGAADGFNVMPPWLPGSFDVFAEQVVPILRKRGVFREDYSGKTLRLSADCARLWKCPGPTHHGSTEKRQATDGVSPRPPMEVIRSSGRPRQAPAWLAESERVSE